MSASHNSISRMAGLFFTICALSACLLNVNCGSSSTGGGTGPINSAPTVTMNPASQIVADGNSVSFTAAASATPTPTVLWQVTTDGGLTFAYVSGANSTTYSFRATAAQNRSQFRAVFANTMGAVATSLATLTVTVPASFVLTGIPTFMRSEHTATLLNNGRVLLAGGSVWRPYGPLSSEAELFIDGTIVLTGGLNAARSGHTATLLSNGKVLIAAGISIAPLSQGAALGSAELYDPATGAFTPAGNMSIARGLDTATLLNNGMVLMAGGYDPSVGILANAELYNSTTETFTPTTGSLNVVRSGHTATLLNNGKVLIAGGQGYGWSAALSSAELYDPATQTFTPTTGSLNTARYFHTATLLNNGMVLIVGGIGLSGTALASAELYNPATETFAPTTGSLNLALLGHTTTLLNNGNVLIAGGSGVQAELYDPVADIFTPTESMNFHRGGNTATLLNDGNVLIAGGNEDDLPNINNEEIYMPATLTPSNLVSIAITPGTSSLSPGATRQFIATGTFSDNTSQQLASVTWSSSDPAIAQINNDVSNHGLILAAAPGTVTVTATAGSVSGSATLTVR